MIQDLRLSKSCAEVFIWCSLHLIALVSAFLCLMSPAPRASLPHDAVSIVLYYLVTSSVCMVSVENSNLTERPDAIVKGNCSFCGCHLSLSVQRVVVPRTCCRKQTGVMGMIHWIWPIFGVGHFPKKLSD